MFRNRPLLAAVLLVAVSLLIPALGTAAKPAPQSCQVFFCPSTGLNFICCPFQGPDCPCNTCADYC
ncbi:MAG TPA: hypothetical protein VGX68_22725 [Thermoanaerobaculia bacterium]|nr:hypothetical protein [Thermoanaerobaculia bacterium]